MALEKFCLCCKLRNGVVIFGVLGIILNLILLAVTLSTDILIATSRKVIFEADERRVILRWRTTPQYWACIVMFIIDLIITILLVVGAVKRNHFLMLPWVIVHGIVMIPFALVTAVLLIAGLPIYGPVYIWWCICSAYQKIQDDPHNKLDTLSLTDNLRNAEKFYS